MEIQPSTQPNNWPFRRVVWTTLVLVFVVLGFWLIYRFYQVVFSFFIAIILGMVLRPVVTWLHKRGLPRLAGVILIYILLLALVIGFLLLLFPLIFEQGATIAAAIPGYYQSLREWMFSFSNQMMVTLGEYLPTTLQVLSPIQQTGEQVLTSAGQAMGYISSAARFIFMAIAILLLALHWTLEGPRNVQSLLQLVPKGHRESIGELVSAIETKVGYFIAGQAVLCLIIGVMALIAYLIIGLPNALVLALVAGLMEAVPMVGPLLGAIPAGVIALSIAPTKLIWVVVASIVIQQTENILLVPRVMRRAVGVNPFVSLLSIFAFSSLFGITGALMAIPIAAIIQLLLNRYVFHPTTGEAEVSTGRGLVSRLRYEVKDLTQDLRKQARLKKEGSVLRVKQIDQVMDEIETITTDLDALLAQVDPPGAP